VSDFYTLTASWDKALPNHEGEPDDSPVQALAVTLDAPMHGYLSRADDVDYYYVRGEGGGTLSGEVTGVDGADVRIVVLPSGSTFGPPGALPTGSKVFDSAGPGAGEKFDGVSWPAGTPSPLIVVQRKLENLKSSAVANLDKRHHTPRGLDVEYTLSLRLKP
jgi:hypothetical protein